jgi:hypothetical protein
MSESNPLIPVRVLVFIDKPVNSDDPPDYVYDKLIPEDALTDLEDELDTVVGQYDDNPANADEYEEDIEASPTEDIFVKPDPEVPDPDPLASEASQEGVPDEPS